MIKGLAHVCIAAKDLERTERFYCSALGFRKAFDFIRGGKVIGFYLAAGRETFIEVFRQDDVQARAQAPIGHVCLEVDDIDQVIGRLKSLGCEASAKQLGGDRSWQSWTTDPSGVRIEFHQYTPQSCQLTGQDCVLD